MLGSRISIDASFQIYKDYELYSNSNLFQRQVYAFKEDVFAFFGKIDETCGIAIRCADHNMGQYF